MDCGQCRWYQKKVIVPPTLSSGCKRGVVRMGRDNLCIWYEPSRWQKFKEALSWLRWWWDF